VNIKKTLLSYLSFGEKLKANKEDDYGFNTMQKLTFGAANIKSSLLNKDLKSILYTALLSTAPFAALSVAILAIIYALGGGVLSIVNNFCAGFMCYFIYVLIELFKNQYNHIKAHNIVKSSVVIAVATFILSCGTVIREIYNIITKSYLPNKVFDLSAVTIIFTLVFIAVLTKGKFKLNLNTILASVISLLFVISNISVLKGYSAVFYVRLGLILVMLGLMAYTVIKQNKGLKLNLKAPLIVLGVTVAVVAVISLILRFAFGEISQIKYILSTTFASLFGTDLNSLALLENTFGGGVVANNSVLMGIISVIAYIAPGSYLINAITLTGFNLGFKGENALAVGLLYALMGLVLAVGLTLSALSLVIEYVKSGKDTATLVAIKRYVSAAVMGLIPVTILTMASSFVDLLRVSFSGVFGLLFAAALVTAIYVACNNYKLNRNLAAIISGAITALVMIFSAGIILY